MRLTNRIALVTGASRGIGRATALALAAEGAHVIAVARTVGGLEELDDAIKKAGGGATLVPLDLRDGAAFPRLAGAVAERWKKLDILIGNAGVLHDLTPVAHINPKHWIEAFDVNVNANLRLIQFFDPLAHLESAAIVGAQHAGILHVDEKARVERIKIEPALRPLLIIIDTPEYRRQTHHL